MNTKQINEYMELRAEIADIPDKEFFGCNLYPLTDYADMLESENAELRKQIECSRSEALDVYERTLKNYQNRTEEFQIAFDILRCGLTSAMFMAQVAIIEKDETALVEIDKVCRATLTNAFIVDIRKIALGE